MMPSVNIWNNYWNQKPITATVKVKRGALRLLYIFKISLASTAVSVNHKIDNLIVLKIMDLHLGRKQQSLL